MKSLTCRILSVMVASWLGCVATASSKPEHAGAAAKNAGRVSDDAIDKAVASGVAYIKKKQMKNGGWSMLDLGRALGGGMVNKHASRYDPGVTTLLRRQNSEGYICGRGVCSDNTVQTCFGLLFFRKIYVPVR